MATWYVVTPRYISTSPKRKLRNNIDVTEYQLSGWVIINGDGGCSFWQPVQADSQPKSSGLVLGRRPLGAVLHSSNEPGELSQRLCHDDSTINIVVVIIIIIIIICILYIKCCIFQLPLYGCIINLNNCLLQFHTYRYCCRYVGHYMTNVPFPSPQKPRIFIQVNWLLSH